MTDKPPLLVWMETTDPALRDAAYLRMYAEHVRNNFETQWDIPTTRARTLEDIAARIEQRAKLS